MRKEISLLVGFVFTVLVNTIANAEGELIPDFYEEPGAGGGEVSVDPFSGSLRLSYLDLSLPGNGGMDINIHRTYSNHHDRLGARRVTGSGWSIHFGRVMVTDRTKLCSNHSGPAENVLDNPMVELPDGSMQQLFYADFEPFHWISSDRWKADCIGGDGIVLTSPDGLQYTMDYYTVDDQMVPGTPVDVWYTSKITDRHGNEIYINYTTGGVGNGYVLIDTITAADFPVENSTDNRLVEFNYINQATNKVLLSEITAHGQTWTYEYTEIPGVAGGLDWLTKVIRPDGNEFNYDYYPLLGGDAAGSFSMRQITYPYGAVESFSYDYVAFDSSDYSRSTVVSTKSQSGRGIEAGIWTYSYAPGSSGAPYDLDVTTINAPNGVQVMEHVGAVAAYNHGLLYGVGLPGVQKSFDLQGNLIQQTSYEWAFQTISNEDVFRPSRPNFRSTKKVVPIMLAQTTWREGVNYETRYSPFDNDYLIKFDQYGNPLSQVESGTYDSRTTDYSYFHQTYGVGSWLINQVKDEIIRAAGRVDNVTVDASTIRTYSPNGNLLQENKYGVTTDYTYHPTGDLHTTENARGFQTTYTDYKRGTPQLENRPEGVVLSRVVNDRGTIASEKNGRGYVSSYLYDDFDRLTNIDLPINNDASLSYNATGKVLTRGGYQESTILDGFGRPVCVIKSDVVSGANILQQTQYNAVGQKVFESYPSDTSDCTASIPGTMFEYDVLNRLTKATHPDNTFKELGYLPGNRVLETNERGFSTDYYYASYGNPDEKFLVWLDAPENITNAMLINKLGQKTYLWQGETNGLGYKREYFYDSRFLLRAIDHPETGLTQYGLDAVGNITSKRVGVSGTTIYTYDGLDRQTLIDYPNTTPDVTFVYDGNNNIESVNNSSSQRSYGYDENDNLVSESIAIGTSEYAVGYAYDTLDNLATLTYPTGRQVSYAPDALGRASQAQPYVSSVSYYPFGQIRQMVYANGQTTDYVLNNRLWTERIQSVGVSNAVDFTYNYDEVGNVRGITDTFESAYNLSLDYDGADRLTTANGVWGTGSIAYDHNGNIRSKSIGTTNVYSSISQNRYLNVINDGVFTSYAYDVYGNATSNGAHDFIYDDAGNLTSSTPVPGSLSSTFFDYDGNNMRVQRTLVADLTQYVYSTNGNLIGEYGELPADDRENIYLGSKMVASVKGIPQLVANAGVDQIVDEGSGVILDASGSTTDYGQITSYAWTQLSGPTVILNDSASISPTFTAPTALVNASVTFQVTVTNSLNQVSVDSVVVNIQIVDVDGDLLSDYWEVANFGDLTRTASGDVDGDGISNLDEFLLGTDPVVPQPLDPITWFEANSEYRQNSLSWQPVERALGYDIYWSTSPGVTMQNGTLIADVVSPYIHAGLDNGQTYYYILVARNSCCESISQEISATPGQSNWVSNSATIDLNSSSSIGGYVDGRVMLISEKYGINTNSIVVDTYDNTAGWLAPVVLAQSSTSLFSLYSPSIVQGADGSAISVWVERDNSTDISSVVVSHYTPGIGWGSSSIIWSTSGVISGGVGWLQLGMSQNGDAIMMWSGIEYDSGGLSILTAQYNPGAGWSDVSQLESALNNVYALHFDMAASGYAAAAFTMNPEIPDEFPHRHFVNRYIPGVGWQGSELVYSDTVSSVDQGGNFPDAGGTSPINTVAVSEAGDVAVFFYAPFSGVNLAPSSCLFIAKRYEAGVGWHDPENTFVCDGEQINSLQISNVNGMRATYDSNGDLVVVVPYLNVIVHGKSLITHNKFIDGVGWGIPQNIPYVLDTVFDLSSGDFERFLGREVALLPDDNGSVSLFVHELARATGSSGGGEGSESFSGESSFEGEGGEAPAPGGMPDYAAIIQYVIAGENELRESLIVSPSMNDSSGYLRSGDVFAAGDSGNIFMVSVLDMPIGGEESFGSEVIVSEYTRTPGAPRADAGVKQEVDSGDLVTLDGSQSLDNDGSIASYSWSQQKGPLVSLSADNVVSPSFVAPTVTVKIDLVFELVIKDDTGLIDVDPVTVSVYPATLPPVADAGIDQIVGEDTVVTLEGVNSYANSGSIVSYNWQQLSGPPLVPLYTTDSVFYPLGTVLDNTSRFFTVPWIREDLVIDFRLTVTDESGKQSSDVVSMTMLDLLTQPPVAIAEGPFAVDERTTVTLDGSGSYAYEGATIVSYQWTQLSGPTVTLNGANTVSPSFVAPDVTEQTSLRFALSVTDSNGVVSDGSLNDYVAFVRVNDIDPPPPPPPPPGDETPPVTTVNTSTSAGSGVYGIAFNVNEAANTFFRVRGSATIISGGVNTDVWYLSIDPLVVQVDGPGTVTVDYYSADLAGNVESVQSEVLP